MRCVSILLLLSQKSCSNLNTRLRIFFCFVFLDYESLRIGGMVFAVVLFLLGIFLIVSKYGQFEKRCHHPGISAPSLKYKQPRKAGEL
uniref:FXYD domain-containing ion transport regulator n=1 Tax=Oryzias latipes TaxID=8090 RepID=A0A3P9L6R8_ORYLA